MFGYLSGADFEPRCGVLVRFVKKTIQGYETDRYQSGQRLGAPARLAKHVASLHYLHSDTQRRLKRLTQGFFLFSVARCGTGVALVWQWCGT